MLLQKMLAAAGQAWPPFVLVAGLLLIGAVAAREGLFDAAGARVAAAPLPPRALLVALLALVAGVTAVLNLDTAGVFLTPVLVHAARRRRLDERAFLYGAVFMANAASLLLPDSNLTNQLVVRRDPVSGLDFGSRMLPAWLAACAVTAAFCAAAFRPGAGKGEAAHVYTWAGRRPAPPLRLGIGALATLGAGVPVLALPDPALPTLGARPGRVRGRARPAGARRPRARAPVRARGGPRDACARVARRRGGARDERAVACRRNGHDRRRGREQPPGRGPALDPAAARVLVGLDLGPNLAVTGSLSAVLWLQAARTVGARASVATYTRLGAVLAPVSVAAALAALRV
jgi:arsenical pump membrane protein